MNPGLSKNLHENTMMPSMESVVLFNCSDQQKYQTLLLFAIFMVVEKMSKSSEESMSQSSSKSN